MSLLLIVITIGFSNINNFVSEGKFVLLVSIPVTLTTFGITFSFLQYQFATYKSIAFKLSGSHVNLSLAAIFFSLIPFYLLFINFELVAYSSLVVTPLSGLFLIYLLAFSNSKVNPENLINRIFNNNSIQSFIDEYRIKWMNQTDDFKKLNFTIPGETPMHDISESKYLYVVFDKNIYEFFREIVLISIRNEDIKTFQIAMSKFLKSTDLLSESALKYDRDYFFQINNLNKNYFDSILLELSSSKNSVLLQNEFLKVYSEYIKRTTLESDKLDYRHLDYALAVSRFSSDVLKLGNDDAAIFTMSVNRQILQRHIVEQPRICEKVGSDIFG